MTVIWLSIYMCTFYSRKDQRQLIHMPMEDQSNSVERSVYLSPGFDPSTLNMPQLRNILFKEDVKSIYKCHTKAALVAHFREHISPEVAKGLLEEMKHVKRSSQGITNAH